LKSNMAARVHNVFSLAESVLWFQKKRWKCEIPIGSNVKLSRVMAAYGNFTFSSFFLKPQNRFESNLAEMFIGWSYARFLFLVLVCFKLTYWFQRRRLLNIFSIGSYVKIKSSRQTIHKFSTGPPNDHSCKATIHSCTKIVNRLPIGNSRWPPWRDLV
jgi:hypothetical protein